MQRESNYNDAVGQFNCSKTNKSMAKFKFDVKVKAQTINEQMIV